MNSLQKCNIVVNGENIEVLKDTYAGPGCIKIISYMFFKGNEEIGGFIKSIYDKSLSLIGERIKWILPEGKSGKYNRYFLTKMAKLADDKLKGE